MKTKYISCIFLSIVCLPVLNAKESTLLTTEALFSLNRVNVSEIDSSFSSGSELNGLGLTIQSVKTPAFRVGGKFFGLVSNKTKIVGGGLVGDWRIGQTWIIDLGLTLGGASLTHIEKQSAFNSSVNNSLTFQKAAFLVSPHINLVRQHKESSVGVTLSRHWFIAEDDAVEGFNNTYISMTATRYF